MPSEHPIDLSLPGLSRVFLEVLREYFKVNSRQFIYREVPESNSLIIDNSSSFQKGYIQQRPALYVKRGALSFQKVVIGDRSQAGRLDQGTVEYIVECSGSHTVFCMSRTEGECEKLSEEASNLLITFKSVIRRDFGLQRLEVTSVGEVALLEEEAEIFVVPITLIYNFSKEWLLKQESLKLKLSMSTEAGS